MPDTFVETVETEHLSYGQRIKNSCGAALCLAPFLFLGCIALLVWNEGNSIRQHKALREGKDVVVELKENIQQIQSNLDGSLIHFTGTAETSNEIFDNIFGVGDESEPNILMLRRNVEMYQWVENVSTKKSGDTTQKTYNYEQRWKSGLVQSSSFRYPNGHENPYTMLYQDKEFVADPIVVGAHQLSDNIISRMKWYKAYNIITLDQTYTAPSGYKAIVEGGDTIYVGKGTSSRLPQVGDYRISFDYVKSQIISVVAKQTGTTLSSYTGESGGTFLLVQPGNFDALTMFQKAQDSQTLTTWLIRLGGFLGMFLAFFLLLSPLAAIADPIPIIGDLVEMGTCLISGILGFLCAGIVVVCAWLAYRPIISACIFVVLVTIWVGIALHIRKKRKARQSREVEDVKEIPEGEAVEIPQGDVVKLEKDNEKDIEEP